MFYFQTCCFSTLFQENANYWHSSAFIVDHLYQVTIPWSRWSDKPMWRPKGNLKNLAIACWMDHSLALFFCCLIFFRMYFFIFLLDLLIVAFFVLVLISCCFYFFKINLLGYHGWTKEEESFRKATEFVLLHAPHQGNLHEEVRHLSIKHVPLL